MQHETHNKNKLNKCEPEQQYRLGAFCLNHLKQKCTSQLRISSPLWFLFLYRSADNDRPKVKRT